MFEAERGNGELSDIAIDDITFTPGACGTEEQGKKCIVVLMHETKKKLKNSIV